MINLIVSDLDGTLLTKEHIISQINIEAIKRAQNEGIEVSIATGRMYYDVQARLKHAGLSTHIIGANGATVQLASGERLYTAGMNKSELIKGLQWMVEEHHYFALYTDEAIYVHRNGYNWVKSELDAYKRNRNHMEIRS